MTVESARKGPPTYGHWRRPRSAGLAGLGTGGTVLALLGIVVCLVLYMVSWLAGVIAAGVLVVTMAPLAVRVDGRSGLSAMVWRIAWWRGRRARQHLYRNGPTSVVPEGKHRLPGLLAPSVLYSAQDAYGREFGLVYVPHTGHYTAVVRSDADGSALVDPETVDQWVANWGAWLAQLSHEPAFASASVTIESAPDSGERLANEVDSLISDAGPELSHRVLREAAESYPRGSAQVTTRVAVTYRATTTQGKRRSSEEMAIEIGTRLPSLAEGLALTGAGAARPMTSQQLAEFVFAAYNPAEAVDVDRARSEPGGTGIAWDNCGPNGGSEERRDRYAHGSGYSITWAMEEAPRGTVLSSVLSELLRPHRDIHRKRVTLIYRPHDRGQGARIVDDDLKDARFLASRKRGGNARDDREVRAAQQSAAEEAEGAGVVRFALLVTATVVDPADYRQADSAVKNMSAASRLRLRRVYGGQSAAFAGALGIGVLLPNHANVPSLLSEHL